MRLLLILLSLIALTSCAQATTQATNESVFRVMTQVNGQYGGGSGFLVQVRGRQLIITNRHVCDRPNDNSTLLIDDNLRQVEGTIVLIAQYADLCAIKPLKPIKSPVFKVALHEPTLLDPITTHGYPGLGRLTHEWGYFVGEVVLNKNSDADTVGGQLVGLASFEVKGGQSGSPVLNMQGEVAAVVFAHESDGTGILVPHNKLQRFMAELEGSTL
jgi:S1-C subfamily serine protease